MQDVGTATAEEISAHAEFLGMKPGEDGELIWIAEMSLCAPTPDGYTIQEDHMGRIFYFCAEDGTAQVGSD